ncbi:DUF1493 family protein [Granulicella sp. WH15]|uniref:DUF1493 family protein n=1 Tax=Granulicella sp. WH15 TaxID=2602070 RepID=UPI0013A53919|nr:DUF1493 family protein [Granulicella sp. WH15]
MKEPEHIETRIKQIVAAQISTSPDEIHDWDTIDHSLGLAGDDVDEIFKSIADEFNVDFSELDNLWQEYFLPEVSPSGSHMIVVLLASVPGFIVAMLTRVIRNNLPHSAFVSIWITVSVASTFAWGWVSRVREKKSPPVRPQISIADLVAAARTGKLDLHRSNS